MASFNRHQIGAARTSDRHMKTKCHVTQQQEQRECALFTAILAIESVEECRSFLRHLCAPNELQAVADRWVKMLVREQAGSDQR